MYQFETEIYIGSNGESDPIQVLFDYLYDPGSPMRNDEPPRSASIKVDQIYLYDKEIGNYQPTDPVMNELIADILEKDEILIDQIRDTH